MVVEYELTHDDLYAFQWRAMQISPVVIRSRRKLYAYLFVAVALVSIVPAIGPNGLTLSRISFGFLVISYAVVAGVTWFLERRLTRKTILELLKAEQPNKGQLGKHTVELNDAGVVESTDVGEQRTSWRGIHRVEDDDSYIYIYTAPSAALVIPRRAFAGVQEAQEFVKLARSKTSTA